MKAHDACSRLSWVTPARKKFGAFDFLKDRETQNYKILSFKIPAESSICIKIVWGT